MEDLLIGDAAAKYLGVTRARLYQLAATEHVGKRVGGHWVFTQQELDSYRDKPKGKGGRPQTTYKLTPTPARQLHELAAKRNMHPEALLTQLIKEAAQQGATPVADTAAQLLNVLDSTPQSIATLCKRLRMTKSQLQAVCTANRAGLEAHGVHFHVATASDVVKAIKLASLSNADESKYYSRISKPS
jgi:hypothetical protein